MNPAYRRARFRVDPPSGGLPASFAVLTVWNPEGSSVSAEENAARTKGFSDDLLSRGLEHFPVTGFDPESDHAEPGFGVVCDRATALDLGRSWEQEAIFYIEDGKLVLVPCEGSEEELAVGTWQERVDKRY